MNDNRALLDLDSLPRLFSHHVANATELIELGIPSSTIHERCLIGGPWQRLPSGLLLLDDKPPTRVQQIQEALTVAGRDAVISGVDALALHGMSAARLTGPVHVLVPANRQPRLVDGAYFERTQRLPVGQVRATFPVAPLPRATIDTCRRAHATEHVRALLLETIHRGRITTATLRDELERCGGKGKALPRRILAEIDDGVRSMAQGWARQLVRQAGLPAPRWRVPITASNGAHVATADAWWDDVGLAWEVDSYAFELSPADCTAALRRAACLTATGILVVHTEPMRLRNEPDKVADLLRSAYEQAAARPRPPVVAA